jgi:hypothetical protein
LPAGGFTVESEATTPTGHRSFAQELLDGSVDDLKLGHEALEWVGHPTILHHDRLST